MAKEVIARRPYKFLKSGYIVLSPALLFWVIWWLCFVTHYDAEPRVISFYKIVPHFILGIDINWIIVIISFAALMLGVLEKEYQHTRWYKTKAPVQRLIILGGLTFFSTILQTII